MITERSQKRHRLVPEVKRWQVEDTQLFRTHRLCSRPPSKTIACAQICKANEKIVSLVKQAVENETYLLNLLHITIRKQLANILLQLRIRQPFIL